jgi:DNA repair exonuclease SbcCD ATPase subunit
MNDLIEDYEKRDIVWVPEHIAKKYNNMENSKKQLEFIDNYLNESTKDLQLDLESFEDSVIQYRGLMLKAKDSFRKAKDEELQAHYDLWENFEKEIPLVSKKINSIIDLLKPLKDDLNEINELLQKFDKYGFDRFLETLQSIRSIYGESKDMIEFLMLNYKRDNNTSQ